MENDLVIDFDKTQITKEEFRIKIFDAELSKSFVLNFENVPKTTRVVASEMSKIDVKNEDVPRLFEIARAKFRPVPKIIDLTAALTILRDEIQARQNKRFAAPMKAITNGSELDDDEYSAQVKKVREALDFSSTAAKCNWVYKHGVMN